MGQFGPLPRVGWDGKLVLALSEDKGHAQFVEPLQPLKYLKKVVQHVIFWISMNTYLKPAATLNLWLSFIVSTPSAQCK